MVTGNYSIGYHKMLNYTPIILPHNCSAKCRHCTASNTKNDDDVALYKKAKQTITNTMNSVFLFTGGEPLESAYLTDICHLTNDKEKYFRIATGGHIPLIGFFDVLQLTFCTGLSLSMDAMIEKISPQLLYYSNWVNNISFLNSVQIPYSLTLTILEPLFVSSAVYLLIFFSQGLFT